MKKRRISQRLKKQKKRQLKQRKFPEKRPRRPIIKTRHIKREQTSNSFITDFHRCHLCQYRTNSSYFIYQHYKRHQSKVSLFDCSTEVPKYNCANCELNTEFAIALKDHQCYSRRSSNKQTLKSYTCEQCCFRTYSRLVQLRHAQFRCVDKDTPISAPRQRDYFKSYQFLLQIQHSNVEWLKCDHCSYMARLDGALGSHMMTEHSKDSSLRWYNCKLCLFNVEQIFYLRQHILIEHGQNEDELDY